MLRSRRGVAPCSAASTPRSRPLAAVSAQPLGLLVPGPARRPGACRPARHAWTPTRCRGGRAGPAHACWSACAQWVAAPRRGRRRGASPPKRAVQVRAAARWRKAARFSRVWSSSRSRSTVLTALIPERLPGDGEWFLLRTACGSSSVGRTRAELNAAEPGPSEGDRPAKAARELGGCRAPAGASSRGRRRKQRGRGWSVAVIRAAPAPRSAA